MAPHVRELTDLPRCEPVLALGSVFLARRTAFLVYETDFTLLQRDRIDGEEEEGTRYAVVRLDRCSFVDLDVPNDEALHNHPCQNLGLEPYRLQEIVESPFIVERSRMAHMDGIPWPGLVEGQRHFVFAFKDVGVECIAHGYECVGEFPSEEAAEQAVRERLFPPR
jgi:hypothetical protein